MNQVSKILAREDAAFRQGRADRDAGMASGANPYDEYDQPRGWMYARAWLRGWHERGLEIEAKRMARAAEPASQKTLRIRALSVRQPWANMIATGEKTIETRDWQPDFRGQLLIVSGRTGKIEPRGCAVAICRLADCRRMRTADEAAACVPWKETLFAWLLANVRRLEPFPVLGRQGIWWVEVEEEKIKKACAVHGRESAV